MKLEPSVKAPTDAAAVLGEEHSRALGVIEEPFLCAFNAFEAKAFAVINKIKA